MGRATPTLHLVCPFCGKHLRTDRTHAGREGLCPRCDKIFDLPAAPQGGCEADEAPEYASGVILALAGGVGFGLALLAASSLLGWSTFAGSEGLFLGAQKVSIVVGSLACLVAMLVALAGRKSLLPPVLVSGAWGMTAAVWIAGSAVVMGRSVGEVHTSPVEPGLYVALVAACIVVVVSGYLMLALRHEPIFRGLAAMFAGLQVAGVAAGVLIVTLHVAPGLQARAESSIAAQDTKTPNSSLYVAPGTEDSNLVIGNKEWKQGGLVRRGAD